MEKEEKIHQMKGIKKDLEKLLKNEDYAIHSVWIKFRLDKK